MLRTKHIILFLTLALLGCKEQGVLPIVEPFSPGTLDKLSKAPDMGVGSISIGVGTELPGLVQWGSRPWAVVTIDSMFTTPT
jgi:hypothetical protein